VSICEGERARLRGHDAVNLAPLVLCSLGVEMCARCAFISFIPVCARARALALSHSHQRRLTHVRQFTTPIMFSAVCHCTICRAHSGAPFVHSIGVRSDQVAFTKGESAALVVKPAAAGGMERLRCGMCGAPMGGRTSKGFWALPAANIAGIFIGNKILEDFKPAFHVYYSSRVIDLKDGLPHFKEAAGGEQVTE